MMGEDGDGSFSDTAFWKKCVLNFKEHQFDTIQSFDFTKSKFSFLSLEFIYILILTKRLSL